MGIPYLGARNPHCPEYTLIHEILVGIPSSGDSVQWGFRPVGIPGGNQLYMMELTRNEQKIVSNPNLGCLDKIFTIYE